MQQITLDFWQHTRALLDAFRGEGVLCCMGDVNGEYNVITLGWGQIGPSYHGHPVLTIAVTPQRYSWRFLEEEDGFVIAVAPDKEAARLCGTLSGRDTDKFRQANLTPMPSPHVRAPSVLESPLNVVCRTYARVHPPHMLLTPEHRRAPLEKQHTIYFAEVLEVFRWSK